jgi:hypothetical protein
MLLPVLRLVDETHRNADDDRRAEGRSWLAIEHAAAFLERAGDVDHPAAIADSQVPVEFILGDTQIRRKIVVADA